MSYDEKDVQVNKLASTGATIRNAMNSMKSRWVATGRNELKALVRVAGIEAVMRTGQKSKPTKKQLREAKAHARRVAFKKSRGIE